MVAIAILLVIVLLFGQMLAIMNKAWIYGHGRANNFTKARAMLDLLSEDIRCGVFRPDLPAFLSSGSPAVASLEFYTLRPGIPASGTTASQLRNVSIVDYIFTAPDGLQRGDSAILWSGEASSPSFNPPSSTPYPTTPTPRNTAPGVIAFQVVFVQADGTFSTTYTPLSVAGVTSTNPTRAVSISIAVIDDLTLKQLTGTQLNNLNMLFTSTSVVPTPILHSVKSYWDAYLNSAAMPWNTYPKGLGSSLATFERYITLPNAP